MDEPGPLTLQDINHQDCYNEYEDGNKEAIGKFEWDSDSGNVIDASSDKYHSPGYTLIKKL